MKIRFLLGSAAVLLTLLLSLLLAAAQSKRPRIVFVSGDHEYGSEETFPILAAELEKHYGMQATVMKSYPDENAEENIPGLEALDKADVAVLFLRWRRLPAEQLEHIRKYLDAGKPVVAFRTTTHAFNYPKGHPLEKWNSFAVDYLGAPPGWGNGHYHYGHKSSTDVSVIPSAVSDPILTGVDKSFHVRSWLYHVLPNFPPADAKPLLMGRSVDSEKKDAVENPVAWTWKNKAGGKVFVTTLGHPEDFQLEAVQRLVINGIHWAAGKPVPKKAAGKINFAVTYHGIRPSADKTK
ncbi:MAG TPA: ThuA domain-containing protein [Blastocatellia bacterium]|nr:ThuA domain-containing protein [Blastocatellia bacterium]HMV82672.1 ThuA domain-containing protein [Blastocatellia bacterium]HMX29812.1 ThuA domain-containing protein [Blastocatellia bacterium]HMY72893.1 ThuA domain-containing protein [Blastocatellia bacterium]HMZ16811.1 ThuA domain-containing protein [Blastocatellia bacterium]